MSSSKLKFSLIMGTLGRSDEIALFVQSLFKQVGDQSWELIIVDQNLDDRVERILQPFSSLCSENKNLRLIKSDQKGLSRARNIGLELASGEYIAFPDDDCIYGSSVLSFVHDRFCDDPGLGGLTLFDVNDREELSRPCRFHGAFEINDYNLFSRAISYTIFLRATAACHRFDERFGVGAIYGATEETDYLFRALGRGCVLRQFAGPVVFHPDKTGDFSNVERAYSYNIGVGAFFAKHLELRRPLFLFFFITSWFKLALRLIQKAVLFHSPSRRWYFAIAHGRIIGMWHYFRKRSGVVER